MATVTVFTSDRTAEIEAASITSGEINSAGHLILNRHDGTPIDMGAVSGVQLDGGTSYAKADVFSYVGDTDPGAVPDGSVWFDTTGPTGPFASTTQQGLVELATDAEAIAGVDTSRAVTPANLAATLGAKILAPNANTETAVPTAYPLGISQMSLTTGSGWSINSGFGSVITYRTETDRTVQHAFSNPGGTGTPRMWQRQYHTSNNGGGWTAWSQIQMIKTITAASITQSSLISAYPTGLSRVYFDNTTSTGWDFAGKWGDLVTFIDGSDFARQTWTEHGSSGSTPPTVWTRSGNSGGWSLWAKYITDPGAWTSWTPTWSTQSGLNTPSYGNAVIACKYQKIGRKVECHFSITFGSSTNFGGGGTGDNWQFSLPVTAASSSGSVGFLDMDNNSNGTHCMGRARLYTAGGVRIGIASGRVDYSAVSTGDVDAVSPFTWVSGSALVGHFTYESAS